MSNQRLNKQSNVITSNPTSSVMTRETTRPFAWQPTLFTNDDLPTLGNPQTKRVRVAGSMDGRRDRCCRTCRPRSGGGITGTWQGESSGCHQEQQVTGFKTKCLQPPTCFLLGHGGLAQADVQTCSRYASELVWRFMIVHMRPKPARLSCLQRYSESPNLRRRT